MNEDTYGIVCDETSAVLCRCGHVQGFHVAATSANGQASYCVELGCRCDGYRAEAVGRRSVTPFGALAAVEAAIATTVYACSTEAQLQEALAQVLAPLGATREVVLSEEDRIDFMVGMVGVEVKMKGGISALTRQLLRYAKHDRVGALVLVTTRETYRLQLPREMNGKPLHVMSLLGAFS